MSTSIHLQTLETVLANVSGAVRREFLHGREYYVAPMRLIKPGVLNGSKGPLYYPLDEVERNPDDWNGMPMVVYHPQAGGRHVSARDPKILSEQQIGSVYRASIHNALDAEGWFDKLLTEAWDKRLDPEHRILPKLLAGKPVSLSTGLFTENEIAENGANFNGRPYTHIARNYKPDHLAILPDIPGACSLDDGCGVHLGETTHNATSLPRGGDIIPDQQPDKVGPGVKLIYPRWCPDCRAEVDPDSGQCKNCGRKTVPTFNANPEGHNQYTKGAVGHELKKNIVKYMEDHGGEVVAGSVSMGSAPTFGDMRHALGHKKFDSSNPLKNPVHKAVKELRDSGHIEVAPGGHGGPGARLTGKKLTENESNARNQNTEGDKPVDIQRSFWQWFSSIFTGNAGKFGNPQSLVSGKFKHHGSGTGKGDVHEAAQSGHMVLTDYDRELGADAHKQLQETGDNPASWVEDEGTWEKAKAAADKGNYDKDSDQYWAVVSHIYQQMGGKIKSATENGGPGSGPHHTTGIHESQHLKGIEKVMGKEFNMDTARTIAGRTSVVKSFHGDEAKQVAKDVREHLDKQGFSQLQGKTKTSTVHGHPDGTIVSVVQGKGGAGHYTKVEHVTRNRVTGNEQVGSIHQDDLPSLMEELLANDTNQENEINNGGPGSGPHPSSVARSSSEKATNASAKAFKSNSIDDHAKANDEHMAAAKDHETAAHASMAKAMEAAHSGNAGAAANHLGVAKDHVAKAGAHKVMAMAHDHAMTTANSSGINQLTRNLLTELKQENEMTLTPQQKAEAVKFLTTNCDCWKNGEAALNSLPDDNLAKLVVKEKKVKEQAKAYAERDKIANAAEEYAEKNQLVFNAEAGEFVSNKPMLAAGDECPECGTKLTAKDVKTGKCHDCGEALSDAEDDSQTENTVNEKTKNVSNDKGVSNNNKKGQTLQQWEDSMPPAARAVWNSAKNVEKRERTRLLKNLKTIVDNEPNQARKEMIINKTKQARTVSDLEELLTLVAPVANQNQSHDRNDPFSGLDDDTTIYPGDPYSTPIGNADMDENDVLIPARTDFVKLAEERRNKVAV